LDGKEVNHFASADDKLSCMNEHSHVPIVLSIAGHDPSGGAGIQADIEAIVSMSCHASTVITAITAQDTHNVYGVYPLPPGHVVEQAQAVLDDLPVDAIKIGLLGSLAIAEAVAVLLERHPDIPVVLDPVLWASGGGQLAETQIVPILCERLLPQTTILTPNIHEARQLAQTEDLDACGYHLRELGCEYVLITGGDDVTPLVENHLYGPEDLTSVETWPRFEGSYHGSGCTLSAAIAGLLAQGHPPLVAIQQAQQYTWEAIQAGYRPGKGQLIPSRLFWAEGSFN
jgi:hydroxymethylpyrimidine/phosphomethylpyrimidine kinase